MRIVGFFFISFALAFQCFSQERFISSAPEIDPFNLSQDQLGSIQSTVNLFNGSVNLPLNLVSIPSPGGIGMNVSIQYSNSLTDWQSEIWNLEAPTGILGLGWNLEIPKIVVNHMGTGTRMSDVSLRTTKI